MSSVGRVVALATVALLASGCASTGGDSQWMSNDAPLPAYQVDTAVEVRNNNWADMVVYAVRYNSRVRLGMVTSMNSRSFDLPKSVNVAGGSVELVAETIGARDRYITGPISIHEGQRIELTLENQLPISTWSVW